MFQIYFTDRDAIHDYRDYCKYADTKALFAIRARTARSWNLYDAIERFALDHFDRSRRC